MTPIETASAWDSMSDQQKVEWLATEIMGWKVIPQPEGWTDRALVERADGHVTQHWNPFADWTATTNIWVKMRERGFFAKLEAIGKTSNYCEFYHHETNKGGQTESDNAQQAICRAAYLALNAL